MRFFYAIQIVIPVDGHELNDIRLPPPCLAEYDSLVPKGRPPHDD